MARLTLQSIPPSSPRHCQACWTQLARWARLGWWGGTPWGATALLCTTWVPSPTPLPRSGARGGERWLASWGAGGVGVAGERRSDSTKQAPRNRHHTHQPLPTPPPPPPPPPHAACARSTPSATPSSTRRLGGRFWRRLRRARPSSRCTMALCTCSRPVGSVSMLVCTSIRVPVSHRPCACACVCVFCVCAGRTLPTRQPRPPTRQPHPPTHPHTCHGAGAHLPVPQAGPGRARGCGAPRGPKVLYPPNRCKGWVGRGG